MEGDRIIIRSVIFFVPAFSEKAKGLGIRLSLVPLHCSSELFWVPSFRCSVGTLCAQFLLQFFVPHSEFFSPLFLGLSGASYLWDMVR